MLDAKRVVDMINQMGYKTYKFDYSIYSNYIMSCYEWYKGYVSSFHADDRYDGFRKNNFDKARLNMGKRVCEDLASLIVGSNNTINVMDKSVREFLLGFNEMTGVLGENNFWSRLCTLVEITNALGTGAFEIVIENLLKVNNTITVSKNSKLKIVDHNALNIIPLSWDSNKRITEVAFVDQYTQKDESIMDLRLHILDENGNYKIVNKKLKVLGTTGINSCVFLENEGVIEEFNTGSNIPWFSVLRMPVVNNYDINSPMGASIYGNSIDILKNIDDAFNALCIEYRTGEKKIFYHKSLLQRTDEGKIVTPDDKKLPVFYYMGDDLSLDGGNSKELIHEHNPELRIEEISKGIEAGLNYLSVMCGLGNSYYKFSAGTVQKTATEVISENSSMYRNIRKDQLEVEKFILDVIKAIVCANNLVFRTGLDINANISVQFDASIIEDKVKIRERDLQEVQLGIMTIEEYRAKYYESDRRDSEPIVNS